MEFTERYVLYLAFDTLVRYGPDFSIQPELAEKWETSADGKRIVFTLRDGVKFQDGTAFDAAAVKWNIDQRMDEKVKSPQRQLLTPIIDSVEVVDPRHVAFNLKAPSPALFSLLGERPGFMVSPTAWQQRGASVRHRPRRHRGVRAEGMDARHAAWCWSATRITGSRACRISTASSCRTWRGRSSACSGC